MDEEYCSFKSQSLKLEGYLYVIKSHPAMVICHPHPFFGGTMNNSIVLALRNAAWDQGIGTLRFNFRGVGGSEGVHSGGVNELDDAISAVRFLRNKDVDIGNIYIAGYSFGADIALKTFCIDKQIKKAVTVASPAHYDYSYLSTCKKPMLFILGEFDYIAPPDKMSEILKNIHSAKIKIVNGANHFFLGNLDSIRKYTADFLSSKDK